MIRQLRCQLVCFSMQDTHTNLAAANKVGQSCWPDTGASRTPCAWDHGGRDKQLG